MSLSSTMMTALSGMTASARAADVVAANLSNLQTDGYGHRGLSLSAAHPGGGVIVNGVTRAADPVLLSDRRLAQAGSAAADMRQSFFREMETRIGEPGTGYSLSDRISRLVSALETASLAPSSPAGLTAVLRAGQELTGQLNELSMHTQSMRMLAEQSIAQDVRALNDSLTQVAALNRQIPRMTAMRQDVSGLIDQRQVLIDRIASILPLREISSDGGTVTLYTTGGVALLDGQPAKFSFVESGTIAANSGLLSGLEMNGRPVSIAEDGPLGGGRLTAAFAQRDTVAPALQQQLDAVARDLMSRFEAADTEAEMTGEPAFLTDAGQRFSAASEAGLAGRISVSSAADPGQGGELWRIWSGMSAAAPADASDTALLDRMSGMLLSSSPTASGGFTPIMRSATDLGATLLSAVSSERLSAENRAGFSAGQVTLLQQREAELGVDSDAEVHALLQIETAFAANTRVIQAVDDMLQQLLRI